MRESSDQKKIKALMKTLGTRISQFDDKYQNIPGWELVGAGLKDLSQGKCNTVSALLVFMAASRLRFLGFDIPHLPKEDEAYQIKLKLYHLLEKKTPDAYSQYNALQRRLASFCATLEAL